MKNSKKETVITGKMVLVAISFIMIAVAVLGLVYGVVNANSMIIAQASSLAGMGAVTLWLNSKNIKKEKEAEKKDKEA